MLFGPVNSVAKPNRMLLLCAQPLPTSLYTLPPVAERCSVALLSLCKQLTMVLLLLPLCPNRATSSAVKPSGCALPPLLSALLLRMHFVQDSVECSAHASVTNSMAQDRPELYTQQRPPEQAVLPMAPKSLLKQILFRHIGHDDPCSVQARHKHVCPAVLLPNCAVMQQTCPTPPGSRQLRQLLQNTIQQVCCQEALAPAWQLAVLLS